MADNLVLKGGTWHVRLAIPQDVRKAFGGRRVLTRSLDTGARSKAMHARLQWLTKWKAEIEQAREERALPEGWQDDISSAVSTIDQWRLQGRREVIGEPVMPRPNTPDFPESVMSHLSMQEFFSVLQELSEWSAGSTDRELMVQDGLAETFTHLLPGLYTKHYQTTEGQREQLESIVADPASYKPKSPITKRRLTKFREFRQSQDVATRTLDIQESKLEKLSAYLSETGSPLNFDSVAEFLNTLGLHPQTLVMYNAAGNAFWKWAMKYDADWRAEFKGMSSPFCGHDIRLPKGKAAVDAQRLGFDSIDFQKLHTAALDDGRPVLADLIQIGFHTGARIEEICQLKVEHLIEDAGILHFSIVDSKTAAGIRTVPVHPVLFLVVERLSANSVDGYLIPSTAKNKYGKRSAPLSKDFGRLKTRLGYGDRHVFHSIRATVITQLLRFDVQGLLIAELVGHETKTVTFDVYAKGYSAEQKFEAISRLRY